jgi:RES domain-containing protein
MPAQILDRVLRCYRIGDPDGAYPIFDATGSTVMPGRWNTIASPVIYASEYYSTALLEKLVRGRGRIPRNQHYIEITIPNGATYEMLNPAYLPAWDAADRHAAQVYGATWWREARSLVLIVPSVVAQIDRNLVINPTHPEFSGISHSLHRPVWWDERLFGSVP